MRLYRGYDADDEKVFGYYVDSPEGPAIIENHELVFVNPSDIGQDTGMLDKNKVAVFEGDRVAGDHLSVIVLYRDGCFMVGDSLLKDCLNNGWVVDYE